MEQKAELRNWRIIEISDTIRMLVGQIYNDATGRFEDGATVRTSNIMWIDEMKSVARTRNTTYTLV
jgi:hypothetical protein